MATTLETRNRTVRELLNGTYTTLKSIVPLQHDMMKPQILGNTLQVEFGVLIGITGDVRGQLILAGEQYIFSAIGESMFGMPVEEEMLASFSGELGNMLAGGLSTNIVQNGIKTDITSPTIMQGSTTLSGYERAIHMRAVFEAKGVLNIYLLLD